MICGRCRTFRTSLIEFWFPHLKICRDPAWAKVWTARLAGENEKAQRLARRAMGIKGPEMSEETKEKLRAYGVEHKDEIAHRAKMRRVERRAYLRAMAAGTARLKRKRS